MNQLKFVTDYRNNDTLRKSFNELTQLVFGFSFECWYQAGYWGDAYTCHSYMDGDKMVCNVSASKLDVICQGEPKKAIQIGTVMTHPDYRNRGLARELMNVVMRKYEGSCDFIYLFGDKGALGFYPKFGFEKITQHEFSLDPQCFSPVVLPPRRLMLREERDMQILLRLVSNRAPVSSTLGVVNDMWLLMFYLTGPFEGHVYYLPHLDAAVVYRVKGETLHIYDVFSQYPFKLAAVVEQILPEGTKSIRVHFTPDMQGACVSSEEWQSEDALFLKAFNLGLPQKFFFPLLSHA